MRAEAKVHRLGRVVIVATVAAACWPLGVAAQTAPPASVRGNQLAYDATMKCFIANGAASGERGDAGDAEAASRYERAARRSFDLAVQLGGKLGFSGGRINQDFGLAQARELPKLVADPAYNRSVAATCKALGLM